MLKGLFSNLFSGKANTPDDALQEAQSSLVPLVEAGKFAAALSLCEKFAKTNPKEAGLYAWLGNALCTHPDLKGKPLETSLVCFKSAIRIAPNSPSYWTDYGNVAVLMGNHALARMAYGEALTLAPKANRAMHGLARIHQREGDWTTAARLLQEILQDDPSNLDALNFMIELSDTQPELQDVVWELAQHAHATLPGDARLNHMVGFLAYKRRYDPEAADRYFEEAHRLGGGTEALFWINWGICKRDLAQLDVAMNYFDRALDLQPDNPLAEFHLALSHLYLEQFSQAWPKYEYRTADEYWKSIKHNAPLWQNEPLAGKQLRLIAEQGIGDEIMFASCLEDLRPSGAEVTLQCNDKLIPMFRRSFPWITVVSRNTPETALPDADFCLYMGSLPGRYRHQIDDFPKKSYLLADPQRVAHYQERLARLGSGRKIGLSWRGGMEVTRKRLRTIPLEALAQLGQIEDVTWVNLQYGECETDVVELQQEYNLNLAHWPEVLVDYDETAALVSALNGVVTVCTSIVHLGGALGQEVLVLAPNVPEWRYGLNNPTMPWYPKVRVLRQRQRGNWPELIERAIQNMQNEHLNKEAGSSVKN